MRGGLAGRDALAEVLERRTAIKLPSARTHHLCEHHRTVFARLGVVEIGRRSSLPKARRVRAANRSDSGKKGEPEASWSTKARALRSRRRPAVRAGSSTSVA